MKLFLRYLAGRRRPLAAAALLAALSGAALALYRVPAEPCLYAAGLCAVAGLAIGAADYARFLGRYRALEALLPGVDVSLDPLPEPDGPIESAYQRLLRASFDAASGQAARCARAQSDMADYYTLWAHQVKTPIAAMRLILQGEDGALSRALQPELFNVERYVDMALNYSRLDGGASDFVIRRHDLDGIVRQAVRRYAPLFIRKKLSLELAPIRLSVLTDEKWLCFAVEQVLSNAIKYTPRGKVEIFTEGEATLVIRDTGIGIAPEDLPRVFDYSFTGLNGRADKRATGVGLFLARRALERLGHGIAIDSEPGRGTAVRIDLRAAPLDPRD